MNSIRTLGMDHFGKEGYLYPNQSKIVKGRDTRNSIVIIRLILGKTPLYIRYMLFCCSRCRLETCYKGRQKPSTLGRANHASDNGIPSFLIMSENDGAGGRRETRFRYSARISIRRWIGLPTLQIVFAINSNQILHSCSSARNTCSFILVWLTQSLNRNVKKACDCAPKDIIAPKLTIYIYILIRKERLGKRDITNEGKARKLLLSLSTPLRIPVVPSRLPVVLPRELLSNCSITIAPNQGLSQGVSPQQLFHNHFVTIAVLRVLSWVSNKQTLSTMLRTYVLSSMRCFQSHSSLSRADEFNTSTRFPNYSRLSSKAKSRISCVVYKTDLHLWLLSILACRKPVSSRIQSYISYSEQGVDKLHLKQGYRSWFRSSHRSYKEGDFNPSCILVLSAFSRH